MGWVKATRRGSRVGKGFSFWAAVVSGVLAAACGGGGSGGEAEPTQAPRFSAGEHYTYEVTSTPVVPAGGSVTTYHTTVSIKTVAADSGSERVVTYGGVQSVAVLEAHTAGGAHVSTTMHVGLTPTASCVYTPAAQSAPPFPTSVGQTWSFVSTQTCVNGWTAAAPDVTASGRVLALEEVTVPAGAYMSHRTERTAVATGPTFGSAESTQTCWYAAANGVALRCILTTAQTPVGASAPTSITTTERVLVGQGGAGKPSVGNQIARFRGPWRMVGANPSFCAALTIADDGAVTGMSCPGSAGTTFTVVSGNVDVAGILAVSLSGGGSLNGALTTPYSASGTWQQGSTSGHWTALHQ